MSNVNRTRYPVIVREGKGKVIEGYRLQKLNCTKYVTELPRLVTRYR